MAVQVNDRIDDPSKAGVERYVGLEHLDSDSLRIRRWGSPLDVEATKLIFRSGDIIFGRRRAYQRKLAVADFDGICSAHAMVLRARPEVVLPDFLPFFMQSDFFMERAQAISVGSLSPTINWKTIAKEEFTLPPIEEQRRMASSLVAIEYVSHEQECLESKILELYKLVFADTALRGWKQVGLGEVVLSTQYGLSIIASNTGRFPILRMMNLEDGLCVENDIKFVDLNECDYETYRLVHGDVLFNRTNSIDLVGRTGRYSLVGEHVFASYLIRIKVDPNRIDPSYLTLFLNSPSGRKQVLSFATKGVSQANVNASNLRRIKLPLPPLAFQIALMKDLEYIKSMKEASRTRREALVKLKFRVLGT